MSEILNNDKRKLSIESEKIDPEQVKKLLKEKAENVAKKYCFESSEHQYAQMLPELNKYFLAMLDEYVNKSGYKFLPDQEINVVDFGCGMMGYYDGYKTFFEKYGENNNEKRNIGIVGWDSDPDMAIAFGERMLGSCFINLNKKNEGDARESLDRMFGERKNHKLDVVTMFAMGPGMNITDPEIIDESFEQAISFFSELLNDNGVIIMTTSFGGAKKKIVLDAIEKSGLTLILCEQNEYKKLLLDANSGFTHEDIIIAVKN